MNFNKIKKQIEKSLKYIFGIKNMVFFSNFFEKLEKNKMRIFEIIKFNNYFLNENIVIDRKKLHPKVYEYIEDNELYFYSPILKKKRKNRIYSKIGLGVVSVVLVFVSIKIYVKPRFKT
jgi:hypothetical protein